MVETPDLPHGARKAFTGLLRMGHYFRAKDTKVIISENLRETLDPQEIDCFEKNMCFGGKYSSNKTANCVSLSK